MEVLLNSLQWRIGRFRVTDEFLEWFRTMDAHSKELITVAIDRLAQMGPHLGRPLVDRIEGSQLHNLKELRPGSSGRSEVRILFVFDPWRAAVLLTGGDKSGNWSGWYVHAIAEAERLYTDYLAERATAEESQRKEGRS